MANKIFAIVMLICIIILFIHSLGVKHISERELITLKPEETSAITINPQTNIAVIQQRHDNGTVAITQDFIPAESTYSVVTSTNTGKTEIRYKKKGITFKPNINVSYSNQLSLGIGTRFFYWNEFGAVAHGNWYLTDNRFSVSLGIDYRLYKIKLKNVALGLSYDTYKTVRGQINIYLS